MITRSVPRATTTRFGTVRIGEDLARDAQGNLTLSQEVKDLHVDLTNRVEAVEEGKADLGNDGKLLQAQLPAISITDYLGQVANQSAMLLLTGQRGDWCARADTSTVWVLSGDDATVLGNWVELSYPTAPVTSVAGRTGSITLTKDDVGLSNVDNTTDLAKPISTATQTALDGKAASVHGHLMSEITGLVDALAGKAASVHGHLMSEITGLVDALAGKADVGHTHASSEITARPVLEIAGIDHTLTAANAFQYLYTTNGSAVTINVPLDGGIPIGAEYQVFQQGAGQVSFAPAGGVTISSKNSNKKISATGAGAYLKKVTASTWHLVGDLTA